MNWPPGRLVLSRTRSDKEMSEIPLVRFDNVVLRFGDTTILDGINLKIWIRDRLVILGQSGSGKSTMLRLIVGILQPTSGVIFYKHCCIQCLSRNELNLLPRLTVGRAGRKIARRDRGDGQRKIGIGRDERYRGQVSGRIKRRYAKAHQPGTGINDGPGADSVRRTVRGTGSGRQVRHRRTYY